MGHHRPYVNALLVVVNHRGNTVSVSTNVKNRKPINIVCRIERLNQRRERASLTLANPSEPFFKNMS